MSFQTIEELRSLAKLERIRTKYALQRNISALRKTYLKSVTKKNGNSGKFWDHRFDAERDESQINFVELDRNQTAYRWLLRLIYPGARVLNVGCGNGKFESLFDLRRFGGVAYEGIDFARSSIEELQKRFQRLHFWVGDITTKKLTHKFDVICVFEVFEHISSENIFSLLKKLYAATEKGGYILVAVPTNEPLLEMFPSNPNEHVRLYTKELICAELEMTGFTIQKVEEFTAFASMYSIKKLLAKTLLKGRWKPNDLLILAQKH